MRVGFLVLCLLAVLVPSAATSADEESIPDRFRDVLMPPDLKAAVALLQGESGASLVKNPVALRTVFAHAGMFLPPQITSMKDPARPMEVIDALQRIVDLARVAHPEDRGVREAAADLLLLRIQHACRHDRKLTKVVSSTLCASRGLRAEAVERPELAPMILQRAEHRLRMVLKSIDSAATRKELVLVIHQRMVVDLARGENEAVLAALPRLQEQLKPMLDQAITQREGPHLY